MVESLDSTLIGVIGVLLGAIATGLVAYVFDRAKEKRIRAEADAKERDLQKKAENDRRMSFYKQMMLHLDASKGAYKNQCKARNRLDKLIYANHNPPKRLQYEELFRKYYSELNEDEKVLFELIRGITKTSIYKHNKGMLELIESHTKLYDELPQLKDLYEHLELWISKYNSLLVPRKDTCLIYTGVEEEKPFPKGIEAKISELISKLEDKGLENQ